MSPTENENEPDQPETGMPEAEPDVDLSDAGAPGSGGAGAETPDAVGPEHEGDGWGPSTAAVWSGEPERSPEGATVPPVFLGVTYAYDDVDEWAAVAVGERPGHIYSRNTNPTVAVFERQVAALEGADRAAAFATGMAAVSNTLFGLLEPGARVYSPFSTSCGDCFYCGSGLPSRCPRGQLFGWIGVLVADCVEHCIL